MKNIETKKTDALTKDLYWLTAPLAKTNGDVRVHITHVYVENNTMTATDGQRLHHLKFDQDIADGYYKIAKRTKSAMLLTCSGDKDWSVYPKCEELLAKPEGDSFVVIQKENNSSWAMTKIIRAMKDNSIDYNFLNDVLSDGNAYDVTVVGETRPIHFESGNKTAIIMPVRI